MSWVWEHLIVSVPHILLSHSNFCALCERNLGSHCVLWFQPFCSSSFLHHNLFGSIYDYFILFPFLKISLLHTAPHFFGVLYPRVFVDFVGHGMELITCHSPYVSRDFQRNILAWDDGSRPLTPPKVREVRWNGGRTHAIIKNPASHVFLVARTLESWKNTRLKNWNIWNPHVHCFPKTGLAPVNPEWSWWWIRNSLQQSQAYYPRK